MIHDNVFLSLGSNLGDRLGFLKEALGFLSRTPQTAVVVNSSIYESEPVGFGNQESFLNLVTNIQTNCAPLELLSQLHRIENALGRERTVRWGPRTVDVDILYWGHEVIVTRGLTIPHPRVEDRRFALVPLNEIASDFEAPPHFRKVREILGQLADESWVKLSISKAEYETM